MDTQEKWVIIQWMLHWAKPDLGYLLVVYLFGKH